MHVVFGILSSNNTAAAVQQIIDTIGYDHKIIVHHDFSKQPEFRLTGANVHVIENYLETSWGDWSLVEATIRLIEIALSKGEFDYFQLLSDTCLPIQPIDKFVDYINLKKPDANIDYVSVIEEPILMMSHGYRAFSAKQTMQHRLLRKLNFLCTLGKIKLRMIAGLSVLTTENKASLSLKAPLFLLQYIALQLAVRGLGFSHPFGREFKCYAGSQWFGCSSAICRDVLKWIKKNPKVITYFKNMQIPDEFFFQTVILNLRPQNIMSSNHFINSFNKMKDYSGPSYLEVDDFNKLSLSDKFFARKFPKESSHPIRLKMLNYINSIDYDRDSLSS
jgi:hypothetical protein